MNSSVCLHFHVHHPFPLRTYRFFDIGKNHYYYDDFAIHNTLSRIAERSYIPSNTILLKQIKKYGSNFQFTLSFSGLALEQFSRYAPRVLESFQQLVSTGNVEILGGTYAHSLASLRNDVEFKKQVETHKELIKKYFNQTPTTFANTELIYSDSIGETLYNLGFTTVLTEGAKHVLGPKSPNFLYNHPAIPKLKLLLNNSQLTEDIIHRFSDGSWSEYPLTTEKYVSWLVGSAHKSDVVNLYFNYQTFGELQTSETGILSFLEYLPQTILTHSQLCLATPLAVVKKHDPIGPLLVSHAISCATEEKDLSLWTGNVLQSEALNKIYEIGDKVLQSKQPGLIEDWRSLQSTDHFYAMNTRGGEHGSAYGRHTSYGSPYDAFINYMNVYSDFLLRLENKNSETPKKKTATSKLSLANQPKSAIVSEKSSAAKPKSTTIKKSKTKKL